MKMTKAIHMWIYMLLSQLCWARLATTRSIISKLGPRSISQCGQREERNTNTAVRIYDTGLVKEFGVSPYCAAEAILSLTIEAETDNDDAEELSAIDADYVLLEKCYSLDGRLQFQRKREPTNSFRFCGSGNDRREMSEALSAPKVYCRR